LPVLELERGMPGDGRPNVLFVMTDQQRADTIAALGNEWIHTPNFDRLVERGVSFTNAYSQCPVCVPARHNVRTGREMPTTGCYANGGPVTDVEEMERRCGDFLPRRMAALGYRTFGVGKFHTDPTYADLGYGTQLYSEETYGSEAEWAGDDYASWIRSEHPEYDHVEMLHGERTEMYYMPQTSPLAAEHAVEAWAADRAIEEIERDGERPFFGLVSFVGPHPPLAPPTPYNRIYDPREMPGPVLGDRETDHADEQLPWMNHVIWATDDGGGVDDLRRRTCWARYCGELTYIDAQLGRILDAVESREDAENTVICFFSDHGDHLGDHHAWQKESFFEQAARVPFLISWPEELPAGERRDELVSLTDLFGIATRAAGEPEPRDGIDVVGMLDGAVDARDHLVGYYGTPGTRRFKTMVREGDWKYVFLANGGRELLFDLGTDPDETGNLADERGDVRERLRAVAAAELREQGVEDALDGDDLLELPSETFDRSRIQQFNHPVDGFPDEPADVLAPRDDG
jgi:choline-sulfatase